MITNIVAKVDILRQTMIGVRKAWMVDNKIHPVISKMYGHLSHISAATKNRDDESDTIESYVDDMSNLLGKVEDSVTAMDAKLSDAQSDLQLTEDLLDRVVGDFKLKGIIIAAPSDEIKGWFISLGLIFSITSYSSTSNLVIFKEEDEMAVKLRWHQCTIE